MDAAVVSNTFSEADFFDGHKPAAISISDENGVFLIKPSFFIWISRVRCL